MLDFVKGKGGAERDICALGTSIELSCLKGLNQLYSNSCCIFMALFNGTDLDENMCTND